MTNQLPASVNNFVSGITNSVVIFFPRIFWAFILVGAGIVLAWIFKKITVKIVHCLDNRFKRAAEQKGLQHIQIKEPLERFIGEIVFWLSLLFFFVLARGLNYNVNWTVRTVTGNWKSALAKLLFNFLGKGDMEFDRRLAIARKEMPDLFHK